MLKNSNLIDVSACEIKQWAFTHPSPLFCTNKKIRKSKNKNRPPDHQNLKKDANQLFFIWPKFTLLNGFSFSLTHFIFKMDSISYVTKANNFDFNNFLVDDLQHAEYLLMWFHDFISAN